jgi:hypothetical protein
MWSLTHIQVSLESPYPIALLSDFGISKRVSLRSSRTRGGFTLPWSSPQQIGGAPHGRKMDVFGLSLIFLFVILKLVEFNRVERKLRQTRHLEQLEGNYVRSHSKEITDSVLCVLHEKSGFRQDPSKRKWYILLRGISIEEKSRSNINEVVELLNTHLI